MDKFYIIIGKLSVGGIAMYIIYILGNFLKSY